MNVERLHEIAARLRADLNKTSTLRILNGLVESLTNQVNSPQQAQYQQQTAQNEQQLLAALEKSAVNEFSPTWRQVLDEIGVTEVTGNNLADTVRGIFATNQITPSVARDDLQKLLNRLTQVSSAIDQLLAAFGILNIGTEELASGDCDVGILVPRAFVDNRLDNFADELEELNRILGAFAELATGSRPGFEIKTISSTDLSVFIETSARIGGCIATAIAGIVVTYKTLLEVRKLRGDLEKQGVGKDDLQGVERHANTLMEKEIGNLVTRLLAEYPPKDTHRKHELSIELKYSLKKLANRIDRGFNIEVRMEEPDVEAKNPEDATPEEQALVKAHAKVVEASKDMQFLKLEGEPILQLPEAKSEKSSKD